MPLASLANLQWNGPASGAMRGATAPSTVWTTEAWASVSGSTSTSPTVSITGTRLRGAQVIDTTAPVTAAAMVADGLPSLIVSVGSRPSADDVAQAVWGTRYAPINDPESFGLLLKLAAMILRNRTVTDPVTGAVRVYADDDATVLLEADLWQDAAGTTPYSGNGAERRDRLA